MSVAVPTPVGEDKVPDLRPVIGATKTVARHLKKGDYVVFESTVYPGATEDVCVPLLEEISGFGKLDNIFIFDNSFKIHVTNHPVILPSKELYNFESKASPALVGPHE